MGRAERFLYTKSVLLLLGMTFLTSTIIAQNSVNNYTEMKVYTDNRTSISFVTFYDGLGRPCATATNSLSDINQYAYSLQSYDKTGMTDKVWMPGIGVSPDMVDIADTATIKCWSVVSNGNDQRPYTQFQYDGMGRISTIQGAGNNWTGKSVRAKYSTNSANSVKRYRAPINSNNLICEGYYKANTLAVTIVKGEDGHSMSVFTDGLGRKILERRSTGNDTYYVYNDYGELRFVLQPRYKQENNTLKYAYEYRYDSMGRCVYKRLPGCEPVLYTYDANGRVATMQDGILREHGRLRFHMYDQLGRNVITGICETFNPKWTQVETTCEGDGVKGTMYRICDKADASGQLPGYATIENVRYYDDYSFLATFPKSAFQELRDTIYGKSRLTGIQTALTGDGVNNEAYDYKAMCYDEWGNCVKEMSTRTVWDVKQAVPSATLAKSSAHAGLMIGGMLRELKSKYDMIETQYSYTNKPLRTEVSHFPSLSATMPNLVEEYEYKYTNVDKIAEITHQLTDNRGSQPSVSPRVTIAKYEYDQLGRLSSLEHNGNNKLKTTFSYNIRGWRTCGENPLFTEDMEYDSPTVNGATPMFSGNISALRWTSSSHEGMRSYTFSYDNLNRLVKSMFGDTHGEQNRYSERVYYDQNGNIVG